MRLAIAAALALIAASSLHAQGMPAPTDLSTVTPIAGSWSYASVYDGTEATFSNDSGQPQLWIRCTRSTRTVSIVKAAPSASPSLWVWTSTKTQSLPATYDAASARLTAGLGAYDPLFDAMASSRGRIGFSTSGVAALVVPPWADVGRVIEDCRV